MIPIQKIRSDKDNVIRRLQKKHFKSIEVVDSLLDLDDKRKHTQRKLDDILAQSNLLSKNIAQYFKEGKKEEAEKAKEESTNLKADTQTFTDELKQIEADILNLHVQIPNIPNDLVVEGKVAEDNKTVKTGGEIPKLMEGALPHWELARKYNIIDFDLGVKLTGAGFPVYKGKGAKLERALIQFFLDRATDAGYLEIIPRSRKN